MKIFTNMTACAAAILAHFKMDLKFSVMSSFSNKDLHFLSPLKSCYEVV